MYSVPPIKSHKEYARYKAIVIAIDAKPFFGALSVAIGALAYTLYVRQTIKKEGIQPHPFSWLLWGFVATVAAFAQHAKGAGPGLWVTAFTAGVCFLIGTLTLSKNKWQFVCSDWMALVLGMIGAVLYAWAKSPTAAAIFATVADVIGYKPTISKGWVDPSTEYAPSFFLNSVKFLPALGALNAYSIATSLYPITLVVVNIGVFFMLRVRAGQIAKSPPSQAPGSERQSNKTLAG